MNTTSRTLNTRNLAVGQELILLKQRANRWGRNDPTDFGTETVKVVKILKNRLVIELPGGGLVRLIVEFSATYDYRNGQVTMEPEGSRGQNYYSTPTWYKSLWTVDDPELAERIEALQAENTRSEVRIAAEQALETFKKSLSVENAEHAVEALQAWITNQK